MIVTLRKTNACILNIFPPPKLKKTFSAEARPKLVRRFNATANYIIEIIRNCQRKTCVSTPLKLRSTATSTIFAYNLRLCKMLSLQRAKPFCANAFSQQLSRIFPATEKDFFANASRPFKGKNAPSL